MARARSVNAAFFAAAVLVIGALVGGTPGNASGAQACDSTVVADFNGDGLEDAAVGDPGQAVNGAAGAGAVHVRSGATAGKVGDGADTTLTQADAGEAAEAGDGFGGVLRVGYVNADSCADLVVGVPREDLGTASDAGVVQVLFGSVDGLGRGTPSQVLRQGAGSVPDTAEAGDLFGAAVEVTPTHETVTQIAVGVPGEDLGTAADAGMAVYIEYVRGNLLHAPRGFDQNTPNIPGSAETGDRFGAAVTLTKVDNVPYVVVGVPGEDIGSSADAGMVVAVLSPAGDTGNLAANGLTQDSETVSDVVEAGDQFGAGLATTNRPNSGFAVGVPGEDLNGKVDAGLAHLFIPGPVTFGEFRVLHQDSEGVVDAAEAGDRFGTSLDLAAEPGVGGFLAIGVPGEDRGTVTDSGAIHEFVIGININNLIDQETLKGVSQPGERFGTSVSYAGTEGWPVLLAGLPDDVTRPAGLVYAVPWPLPPAPVRGVQGFQIWTPGEGGIPAGGISFGAAVAGTTP